MTERAAVSCALCHAGALRECSTCIIKSSDLRKLIKKAVNSLVSEKISGEFK